MTVEEIEMGLPILTRIHIDYVLREARYHIQVNVTDVEPKDDSEQYCLGELTLSDLLFCVMGPPDSRYPYRNNRGLWITSSGPVSSEDVSVKLPEPLPNGAFVHYFFVNDWNAFKYLAAMDANFEWASGDERVSP